MKKFYLSIVLCSSILGSLLAQDENVKVFEKKQNEYGLINSVNNKVVLSPRYLSINPLGKGLFAVKNKKGLVGVVGRDGSPVIPEMYDDVKLLGTSTFEVKQNEKWGLVDFTNNLVLPIEYVSFSPINDDLYEFSNGTKKGYITKYGFILIPAVYDSLDRLTSSSLIATQNGKCGIVDNAGKILVPIQYTKIENSTEKDFISVKSDNKEGLIDRYTLKVVLEPLYDSITPDPIGFLLKSGDKIGFYTKSGKVVDATFSRIMFEQPELGVVVVKEGDKLGFVTASGSVIAPVYDNISRFSPRGIAFVERSGKLQAVNMEGTEMTLQDLSKGYQTPP